MWHSHVKVIGSGSSTFFRFDYDGTTQSDGAELKNAIVTASGFSGGKTAILNLGNNLVNAGNIDSNAYFGITGSSDTTTDDGYGNDSNAVELSSEPELLQGITTSSSVYQAGGDLDVGFDYYKRSRTDSPSIGAVEPASPDNITDGKLSGIIGRPLRGRM